MKRPLGPSAARAAPLLAFLALLASSGAARACGSIAVGDAGGSLGRTVYLTYDVNRDTECGGGIGFDAPRVTAQPQFGQVAVAGGRFRFVAVPGAGSGDRFVIQGISKNKPARLTVNVKFQ